MSRPRSRTRREFLQVWTSKSKNFCQRHLVFSRPAEVDLRRQAAWGRQVCSLEEFLSWLKTRLFLGPSPTTISRRRAPFTLCSGSLIHLNWPPICTIQLECWQNVFWKKTMTNDTNDHPHLFTYQAARWRDRTFPAHPCPEVQLWQDDLQVWHSNGIHIEFLSEHSLSSLVLANVAYLVTLQLWE